MNVDTIEIIKQLCSERGISIAKLERDCGFSNGYIRSLREGKIPSDRLKTIASYFNVSVDYLLTGEEPGYYFDPETAQLAQEMYEDRDMRSLFNMKRNMNPEVFKAHIEAMRAFYRAEHPEEFSDGC